MYSVGSIFIKVSTKRVPRVSNEFMMKLGGASRGGSIMIMSIDVSQVHGTLFDSYCDMRTNTASACGTLVCRPTAL